MEGTKTDETKPHCNDLGDLPRFNVHAVCVHPRSRQVPLNLKSTSVALTTLRR